MTTAVVALFTCFVTECVVHSFEPRLALGYRGGLLHLEVVADVPDETAAVVAYATEGL